MKLVNRLTMNHLDLGIHPKIGAFIVQLSLLSIGLKFKFSFRALKKALQTKWIGFSIAHTNCAVGIELLGLEFALWLYQE